MLLNIILTLLNILQAIVIWDLRKERVEDEGFTIDENTEQIGDYPIITEEEKNSDKRDQE